MKVQFGPLSVLFFKVQYLIIEHILTLLTMFYYTLLCLGGQFSFSLKSILYSRVCASDCQTCLHVRKLPKPRVHPSSPESQFLGVGLTSASTRCPRWFQDVDKPADVWHVLGNSPDGGVFAQAQESRSVVIFPQLLKLWRQDFRLCLHCWELCGSPVISLWDGKCFTFSPWYFSLYVYVWIPFRAGTLHLPGNSFNVRTHACLQPWMVLCCYLLTCFCLTIFFIFSSWDSPRCFLGSVSSSRPWTYFPPLPAALWETAFVLCSIQFYLSWAIY